MIASLEIMMLSLALLVPLYWLIPTPLALLREALVVAASLLLIVLMSPVIIVWLVPYYIVAAALFYATRLGLGKEAAKTLSWGLFLPLAAFEYVPAADVVAGLGWQSPGNDANLTAQAYLGASYCAIRSFLVVREGLARDHFAPMPSLLSMTFFGSYIAGPIAGSNPFVRGAIATSLTHEGALTGLARIGWGAALLLVVKPVIVDFEMTRLLGPIAAKTTTLGAWLLVYKDFLALFVDFAGYSHTAIGTALLFGIKLPENFRNPLVATSMQEFWQRWHMSLGAFISTYLFKPIVRRIGRPEVAIFLAFALIGLWHQVTWMYFIWGVGHGAALMLNMMWRKRTAELPEPSPSARRVSKLTGWVLTMTWVSILSAIANSASLAEAGKLVATLLGQH